MKFRIAIQSIEEGKYKHEHNMMLETEDKEELEGIKSKLAELVKPNEE